MRPDRSADLNRQRQEFQTPSSAHRAIPSAPRRFLPAAPSGLLDQCLHRALDQQPQDRIGISAARTSRADRVSKDAGRIGGGHLGLSEEEKIITTLRTYMGAR
jgi:hypothetical protein